MKPSPFASLLAFALNGIGRRRAKAFAVGFGLSFAVALVSAVLFLVDSLRAEVHRAETAMPDVVVQKLVGGRPALVDATLGARFHDIPSVVDSRARVWGYLFVPALSGNVVVVGTPKDRAPLESVKGTLRRGRDLEVGKHEMVLGEGLAKFLGLRLGDELGLPTPTGVSRPLRVVGLFASEVDLYTSDVVLCDDADARALLGIPEDSATDIAITLANAAEAPIVAKVVLERAPGSRVIERTTLSRVYDLTYGRRAGIVLAAALPALFAFFVLAWDRLSGLGAAERREIAVLKAIGFSTRDVLIVKLAESLFVGAIGIVVGLGLAYLWVFALGAPGLRPVLAGWSVLYPEAPLTPAVDLAALLAIVGGVLGPFALLSVVPAWRAAIVDPMEVMRQ